MLSRTGFGSRVTGWSLIVIGLLAAGCSGEVDPGLDLGPSGVLKNPVPAEPKLSDDKLAAPGSVTLLSAESSRPLPPLPPIRPEDVEKQLRTALRAAERRDEARAIQILDAILAVEPVHREALVGRAKLAIAQSRTAKTPAEREAAIAKAAALGRAVHRAYEKANKTELDLYARVLFNEAKLEAERGKVDRALAIFKESYDNGLDPYFRVEDDESLAAFRATQKYQDAVRAVDDASSRGARDRIGKFLEKPLPVPFDFTLPDLTGKPVSLAEFRGKVVIVDFWGTWCKPCMEAVPGLIELQQKNKRRGFSVIGLDFEQNPPEYAKEALQKVQAVATALKIPYPVLICDDATISKVPGFRGFPTSVVIDRAGKVRLLVTENQENTIQVLADVVQVLLAEPAPKPGDVTKPEPKAAGTQPAPKAEAAAPQPAKAAEPPKPTGKSAEAVSKPADAKPK